MVVVVVLYYYKESPSCPSIVELKDILACEEGEEQKIEMDLEVPDNFYLGRVKFRQADTWFYVMAVCYCSVVGDVEKLIASDCLHAYSAYLHCR